MELEFAIKVTNYLRALCGAHRSLDPVLQERSQGIWKQMNDREKSLAYSILCLTGAEAWI